MMASAMMQHPHQKHRELDAAFQSDGSTANSNATATSSSSSLVSSNHLGLDQTSSVSYQTNGRSHQYQQALNTFAGQQVQPSDVAHHLSYYQTSATATSHNPVYSTGYQTISELPSYAGAYGGQTHDSLSGYSAFSSTASFYAAADTSRADQIEPSKFQLTQESDNQR